MPMYEIQSGGVNKPVDGPYEIQSDGSRVLLQNRDTGPPEAPEAPTILASSAMTSSTSATLNWAAPVSGPEVKGYEVLRDGAFRARLAATARTYTDSSVPGDSLPHVFGVRSVGALSTSVAAQITLQWAGNPQNPPSPPQNFNYSAATLQPTQVDVSWTEQAVGVGQPAIALHRVRYASGVLLKDSVPAAARTTTLTGLTQRTSYNGVYVTRVDVDGRESNPSNTVTFTTPSASGGVDHDPVMGIPFNNKYDQGRTQFTQWAAVRTYSVTESIGDFNKGGIVRVIGATFGPQDPSGASRTGGAQAATVLENALEDFYYGTGSAQRQNCEIHFATDNETDRGAAPTSAYFNTVSLCRDVVWRRVGGVRRYPKASMWIDLTQNNIRTNGSGPLFKPAARYLDGFACSMYPPGRDLSKQSPLFNPYSDYCDDVFATLADWRATGGVGGSSLASQLDQFATWEIGIPIDHANNPAGPSGVGVTPGPTEGEPTAQTDITIRPRYFAGGRDRSGNNWVGFLQYTYNKLDAMGVRMREQLYWNQQSNPDIPNEFIHDAGKTNPDTEHAWRAWVPGSRLPDA